MPTLVPSVLADKANKDNSAGIEDVMPVAVLKPQKARHGHC
jgi:hypothetical protein